MTKAHAEAIECLREIRAAMGQDQDADANTADRSWLLRQLHYSAHRASGALRDRAIDAHAALALEDVEP